MAADRLPDPGKPNWGNGGGSCTCSGHIQCGEVVVDRSRCAIHDAPVSAAVSPAEPPERYVISDERLAEIRALIDHDRYGYRVLPASAQVTALDLAAAVEDLLAERDERTDA